MRKHQSIDIALAKGTFTLDSSIPHGMRNQRRRGPKADAGDPSGWANDKGYCAVNFMGRTVQSSRVIYAIAYGRDPGDMFVDHADRDPTNNDPENLRLVTRSENNRNATPHGASSRFKCVSWCASIERFKVQVRHGGKQHYAGIYADEVEAALNANYEMFIHHGEHANLNDLATVPAG